MPQSPAKKSPKPSSKPPTKTLPQSPVKKPAKTGAKKATATQKVHFTGYPCGAEREPGNTATKDPEKVNCKKCVSVCLKIAEAWSKRAAKERRQKTTE